MRLKQLFAGLAAAALVFTQPFVLLAGEIPGTVAERIAAVESSLVPSARVKGRDAKGTIAERMRQFHVPGVSVAVINNYQLEWAKAYGMADTTEQTPATTDTLFQAASVSKPFTALAALKLVEQGKLNLDQNVNGQLKSWQLPENKFTSEHAVDLRGLLSHTAGLTVHGFPGYKPGVHLPSVPEILDGKKPANTSSVRVDKLPGQSFRYSGGGTTIVQLLITDTTGRPFAEVMRSSVLDPLGMSASSFDQPLPEGRQVRAASAHDAQGNRIAGRWHVYPEMAAAGLWTTPSDIASYVIEIQLAHEGKSQKVLSRELVEQMLTPQAGGPAGLGPFLVNKNGYRRFGHSGGNEGFRCEFVGYLDRGIGAIVMTNADSGGRVVQEVLNAIALTYDWPDYLPPEREADPPSAK